MNSDSAVAARRTSREKSVTVPARRASWRRLLGAPVLTAGAVLVLTRMFGAYGASIVVAACIMVIVVSSLHVLVHWTGQVSLGQVAFVAIGAFVTARANADFGWPLALSVMAGVVGAVVASVVVGLPALRLRGHALAIATLAFGFAAHEWLYLQPWLLPSSTGVPLRDSSLFGFSIEESRQFVVPVVVLALLVVWAIKRLDDSSLGRAMRLVAHDEEVAASYGVSIAAHKIAAFLFAGGCAGLAGALLVLSIGRVGATVFPPTLSILYLSAVLLGGRGPVWGSVVAGAGLGAAPILLGGFGRWVDLVGPVAIVLVVRTFPDGLNGQFRKQGHAITHLLQRFRAAVSSHPSEVQ